MAATSYAAVVSLMHTIDHVIEHGCKSFALNYEQIRSVHEKAAFLVDFLECYSHGDSKEVEALVCQIADAAHAAEDLIESKVVDYIHENKSKFDRSRFNPFHQGLQKVKRLIFGSNYFEETSTIPPCQQLQDAMGAMDIMKNNAMEIKVEEEPKVQVPKYLMLLVRQAH